MQAVHSIARHTTGIWMGDQYNTHLWVPVGTNAYEPRCEQGTTYSTQWTLERIIGNGYRADSASPRHQYCET